MYKDLLKKFIGFSIGNWITVVISLITTPIITRIFVPEEYGRFSMFNLVVNLLLLVVLLGVDQSYMRYYTENNRASLFKKSIKSSMIMTIVVSIIIFIFQDSLNVIIFGVYVNNTSYYIIFSLILQVVLRFLQTDVRMRQDTKLFSAISIVDKIINVVVTLLLSKMLGSNFLSLILAFIVGNLIIIIFIIAVDNDLSFKNNNEESITYKELIKYGIPFMSSLLVFWLFQSFDKFALKYLSDYTELGIYSATMKLILIFNILQNSFMNFWTPVAIEQYDKNKDDKEFFRNMFEIVSGSLVLLGVIVVMFSDFASIILGETYKESANVLPYLIFVPILYTVSETTVVGINFLKRTSWHLVIAIISSIVNIVLNFIFIPDFGAKGAAFATAISYIVFYFTRTVISNKLYKVDYNTKKFNVNILILFLYANYAAFTELSYLNFVIGIVILLYILNSYKNCTKKVINLIIK